MQKVCHSCTFDFRFTHATTDVKLKKLEYQQLSSKGAKNLDMGRLQTDPQGRRMVGIQKIEFHWKVQEEYFLKNCKTNMKPKQARYFGGCKSFF